MSYDNLSLIFDGVCLLIFILNIYLGYKSGFFKTIIKVVSGIVAFFVSMTFAPVLANVINLTGFLPPEYLLFAPFINHLIWYLLTFVIVLIILKVIAFATEIINKAPIIGSLNKLFGALISFIYSFIIVAIISIVVSLPIFSLSEAYEKSILKPINSVAVYCLNNFANIDLEFDSYTETYKEKFYEWLMNNDMINKGFNFDGFNLIESEEETNE